MGSFIQVALWCHSVEGGFHTGTSTGLVYHRMVLAGKQHVLSFNYIYYIRRDVTYYTYETKGAEMKMQRVMVQLPKWVKAKLDGLRLQGTTISGFIRSIVERELKNAPTGQKGR